MQDAFENWMNHRSRELGGEWFEANIAGVTQPGRQLVIGSMRPFDELYVRPERGNLHSPETVALITSGGYRVGCLEKNLASDVTERIRQGVHVRCFVRGLRDDSEYIGVSIGLLQYR